MELRSVEDRQAQGADGHLFEPLAEVIRDISDDLTAYTGSLTDVPLRAAA